MSLDAVGAILLEPNARILQVAVAHDKVLRGSLPIVSFVPSPLFFSACGDELCTWEAHVLDSRMFHMVGSSSKHEI